MTNAYQNSLIFATIGVAAGLVLSYFFRRDRKKLCAALCGGFTVSFADFWGALLAHKLDLWHLYGAWSVLHVPLSLNAAWIFLGTGFCLTFSLLDKLPHPRLAKILLLLGSCAYGVLNDYFLTQLGVLRLGQNMKIYYTFPYWLALVPFTIFVFRFVYGRRFFRGTS